MNPADLHDWEEMVEEVLDRSDTVPLWKCSICGSQVRTESRPDADRTVWRMEGAQMTDATCGERLADRVMKS